MRTTALAAVLLMPFAANIEARADAEFVGFDSDRWVMKDAEVVTHLGRKALSGAAYLKDLEFQDGIIEVDVAVDGSRAYPGIIFRLQSEENYERFYVRPHTADDYPDKLQYAPVFNRVACWQLYNGEGFTAPAVMPHDRWVPIRLEVSGKQARIFIDDADAPALVIPDLKHGVSSGSIGLFGPKNSTARFSNFRYTLDDVPPFPLAPEVRTPPGTLTDWELSRPFPADALDGENYPTFGQIFQAQWRKVTAEPPGLVNVSRYAARSGTGPDRILARTRVSSKRDREVRMSFGYSDDVTIFLNGKRVYSGRNGYRQRHSRSQGTVGLYDALYLDLKKGINEIFLVLTESFGGWGFICQTELNLRPPQIDHGRTTKVWETDDVFKIPESVLYDKKRDMLYVSNYVKYGVRESNTGFISKVRPDGQIDELKWVTGLDGPLGLAIKGDSLYVVESTKGNLVQVDLDTGKVLNRREVPGAAFLNDVIIDDSGYIYVSDTTRAPWGTDIHRCDDQTCEVWIKDTDLHGTNGLYIHNGNLVVGNSGDGQLRTVDLQTKKTGTIACLGGGVLDGIRVDGEGNYIVSHWKAKTYLASPSGEVVEVLDLYNEGLNTADFEFIRSQDLLVIPTFLGNKVVAYRLLPG